MGRSNYTRQGTRPQASKRTTRTPLVTPWHEAGIETLDAYSRTVSRDRAGWK